MNYDEMMRLQAAAERRVGEMNRRSRSFVDACNNSANGVMNGGGSFNSANGVMNGSGSFNSANGVMNGGKNSFFANKSREAADPSHVNNDANDSTSLLGRNGIKRSSPTFAFRDAPSPKNIKMPVEFPERSPSGSSKNAAARPLSSNNENAHFVYDPPEKRQNLPSGNGAVRTNIYGRSPDRRQSVLGNLTREETERLFLLSLCMLLKSENADDELITALMYIMT